MKGLIEYKNIVADVKDVDTEKNIVTGYFSAFNNKDYDGDIIEKGAYSKSIRERGPKGTNEIFMLNQHNWDQPLAKPYILEEDEKGLYFEAKIESRTSFGKDAIILYDSGLVAQHSVGFVTVKSDYIEDTRLLKELFLYEGSPVTLGANSDTPFTGFKAKTLIEAESFISKIIKLLRNGELSDDSFIQLEIALKQLQKDAFELGKKSLEENKPIRESLIIDKPTIDVEKAFISYLN
jgi:uncharacterized protein